MTRQTAQVAPVEISPPIAASGLWTRSAATTPTRPKRLAGGEARVRNRSISTLEGRSTPRHFVASSSGRIGDQLLLANGSSGRARGHAHGLSSIRGDANELLSASQVAEIAGVDVSYVRRLANKKSPAQSAKTPDAPHPQTRLSK